MIKFYSKIYRSKEIPQIEAIYLLAFWQQFIYQACRRVLFVTNYVSRTREQLDDFFSNVKSCWRSPDYHLIARFRVIPNSQRRFTSSR